jgi:hypothetical protein
LQWKDTRCKRQSGSDQNYSRKNDACFSPFALLREPVPQSAFGWQRGARTQVYPQ